MKKHNKQARRLVALTNFYRRHTDWYLEALRVLCPSPDLGKKSNDFGHELRVLESTLPPEMVEWARMCK